MKLKIIMLILFFSAFSLRADIIRIPEDYNSIQQGINIASSGDTILIAAGVYLTNALRVQKPVVIASNFLKTSNPADIRNTIIRATDDAPSEWFRFTRTAIGSKIIGLRIEGNDQHSLAIEGTADVLYCQFINGKDQLSFEGSSSIAAGGYVGYCYFEGAGDDAIDCDESGNWTIEYNTIVKPHEDAVEVRLHDKSTPLTIHIFRYNTVISPGQSGIQLINYSGDSFREFRIYGNIFKDSQGAGVSCMYDERSNENYKGSDMEERAFIYNNTFFGCNYGLTEAPHLVILNNIFMGCKTKGIGASAYVTSETDHSIVDYCDFYDNPIDYDNGIRVGTRLYNVDPEFANTTTFELGPGSECIDRGCAFYVWEGDTVLNIQNQYYEGLAPDIGAVEYKP